jgi:hypothetical protein
MMGAREWMDSHPRLTIAGGCGIVVLAIGLIVAQVLAGKHRYPSGPPDNYYTDDDGKTFFAASSANVPPFDHNGQQAVRAYVFKCGGQQFVGYLERFTPRYHDAVVAHGETPESVRFGREIKNPGEAKWHAVTDLATENKLTDVHCPSGGADIPEAVEP